jgi:predicted Holliday junction resolvase-like endonuclease
MITLQIYKPILLDITLSADWIVLIVIFLVIILWVLYSDKKELNKRLMENIAKVKEKETIIKEQELLFYKKEAELKLSYQNWAFSELEKFKQTEISSAANVLLQKWKIENETLIRQDAINRSYSVNLGKITEHLIPFHLDFPFNPKDARFIGSPIDMIVFDGYSDKKDELIIYIVEIKTGNSKLTEIQKKIKEAVFKGEIRWCEINPDYEPSVEIIKNNLNKNVT